MSSMGKQSAYSVGAAVGVTISAIIQGMFIGSGGSGLGFVLALIISFAILRIGRWIVNYERKPKQ